MAVNISIKNVELNGKSSLLEHTRMSEDSKAVITAEDIRTYDNATILKDLEIVPVLKTLKQRVVELEPESKEYQDLQRILQLPVTEKKSIRKALANHLVEFSQGILAGIIVNYASGRLF